jgi:hypothetical protein
LEVKIKGKRLQNGAGSIILYKGEGVAGNFRRVNTGGRRNEEPLTEGQKEEAKSYAVLLGMPEKRIQFEDALTGYLGGAFDVLNVGTDVLPSGIRSRDPNRNVSLKGTIAHEIVGHREADKKGFTQDDDLLEEVQASLRAARFAPGLSGEERLDLIKDGVCRLNKRGISLREVKGRLRINER